MTNVEYELDTALKIDISYLTLKCELQESYFEYFLRKWLCCFETASSSQNHEQCCTVVMVCCSIAHADFTHTQQDSFTGIRSIIWLPKWQLSHPNDMGK